MVSGSECWGAWPSRSEAAALGAMPSRLGSIWRRLPVDPESETEAAAASFTVFERKMEDVAASASLSPRIVVFVEQRKLRPPVYVAAPAPPSRQPARPSPLPAIADSASASASASAAGAAVDVERVICPHGCGLMVESDMVGDHEDVCWSRLGPCPMASSGCADTMTRRDVAAHLDVCPHAAVSPLVLVTQLPCVGGSAIPDRVLRRDVVQLLQEIQSNLQDAAALENKLALRHARALSAPIVYERGRVRLPM